jgi:hypothetical protein
MKRFVWDGMVEYKNFSDRWGKFKVIIYTTSQEEAVKIFSNFIKRVRNDTFVDELVNIKLLPQLSSIPVVWVKTEGCTTELYHFKSVQVKTEHGMYIMFDFIEKTGREEMGCSHSEKMEINVC